MTVPIVVVIPSLNPDQRLMGVVEESRRLFDPVFVIVDDGSSPETLHYFDELEAAGCAVIHHPQNRGKGAALKTAMEYIAKNLPDAEGFVTADADGQHSPADILAVGIAMRENPESLIMGVRDFSLDSVPAKNRFGNRITSTVFFLQTGVRGLDTQTGLRGIPRSLAGDCAAVAGDRFEYEMNVLLEMARRNVGFVRVPIQTLYEKENHTTHFRTVADSAKVYGKIISYSLSSLACTAVDFSLFALLRKVLFAGSGGVFPAAACARAVSGTANFLLNRNAVFKSRRKTAGSLVRYLIDFAVTLLASATFTGLVASWTGIPEVSAKLIVDLCLFGVNFFVQRKFVF